MTERRGQTHCRAACIYTAALILGTSTGFFCIWWCVRQRDCAVIELLVSHGVQEGAYVYGSGAQLHLQMGGPSKYATGCRFCVLRCTAVHAWCGSDWW